MPHGFILWKWWKNCTSLAVHSLQKATAAYTPILAVFIYPIEKIILIAIEPSEMGGLVSKRRCTPSVAYLQFCRIHLK